VIVIKVKITKDIETTSYLILVSFLMQLGCLEVDNMDGGYFKQSSAAKKLRVSVLYIN